MKAKYSHTPKKMALELLSVTQTPLAFPYLLLFSS